MDDISKLIIDKIDTLHAKVESIEDKVDKHADALNNFKLETLRNHSACREDCNAKFYKLRLNMVKVLGVAAAGGVAGQGVEYILKLI